MTRINTSIKATTPAADAAGTVDQALLELRARLQDAFAQLSEVDDKYLIDEQIHEKRRLMAMLKAEEAAIDASGISGAGRAAANEEDWIPQELAAGWNGVPEDFQRTTGYADHEALASEDPDHYGEYAGTILIPGDGDAAHPHSIGYQMSGDETAAYLETRGRDLVLIVERAGDNRSYYVINDGTVRREPIIISARGLDHGVTIDASHAIRVNNGRDPVGFAKQKIYIAGSDHNDHLDGSQSRDRIAGGLGNDMIDGRAGNDVIWGDKHSKTFGASSIENGGADEIRGGEGKDIIDFGGGPDASYASDEGEQLISNDGDVLDDTLSTPPAADEVVPVADGWDVIEGEEEGTIILRNSTGTGAGNPARGGEIEVAMPKGYPMAFAEQTSDNALVITFVGEDEEGNPATFKVKIEDFFDTPIGGLGNPDGLIRLTIRGSKESDIIDCSRVRLQHQVVNIVDDNGSDSDILLSPRSALAEERLDLDRLLTSQNNSTGQLSTLADSTGVFQTTAEDPDGDGKKSTYAGYQARAENGQIVIEKDPAVTDDKRAKTLGLSVPKGYDHGYITADQRFYYVIMAKASPTGGEPQSIVFRIDRSLVGSENILVSEAWGGASADKGGKGAQQYSPPVILTPVSNTEEHPEDYLLSGGAGNDLIYAHEGYRTDDPGNEVVTLKSQREKKPIVKEKAEGEEEPKEKEKEKETK